MLTQCQKNFARTGYYTLDTTGYYRGKRLNIAEHKMITIRVSTGHSLWIKDNVRCLTGLSLEMAIDTYSVMRRSDRMGEVVFGVCVGWILGKSGFGGYFPRLPDLLLIKRGRTSNPVEFALQGSASEEAQDILWGHPIIGTECGVPLSQGITRFIAPIPLSPRTPPSPARSELSF